MEVLWGVLAFVRTGVYCIFRNSPIQTDASTPYEVMLSRGQRRQPSAAIPHCTVGVGVLFIRLSGFRLHYPVRC